uniref:Uncharacterized protein n=1 Tax=Ursus maritimus TaxID=29073 RepID=A0A452SZR8_URSMA
MGENTQDGTPGSWFKITIPCGRKYDKTWLMSSIQSLCSVPFTPVDFHYVKNQARFFVRDVDTASALKDVSYKICDEENRKISIFVNPSTVPYSVRYKLEPEQMEQLKLTMNKRYDVSQQALDLQSLRFDPDLVGHDIDLILNRRNCMAATLQIIEENYPEVRTDLSLSNNKLYRLDGLSDIIEMVPTVKILNLSKNELHLVWELNKMKGLDLEELWLEGNPLCDTFPDQPTYIRSLRLCSWALWLPSGHRAAPGNTPTGQTNTFCSSFSARSSLCEYFKESRNMKKPKDPSLRVQPLKHTKCDIVRSLCVLPGTQHDFSSFLVDMWFQTVSTCFLPRAAPESHRGYCCLLLKWRESLRVLFVPSPGPSSPPLPAIPGECYIVGGNAHPSLGSGVWEHGGEDILVFSVLWKANR